MLCSLSFKKLLIVQMSWFTEHSIKLKFSPLLLLSDADSNSSPLIFIEELKCQVLVKKSYLPFD